MTNPKDPADEYLQDYTERRENVKAFPFHSTAQAQLIAALLGGSSWTLKYRNEDWGLHYSNLDTGLTGGMVNRGDMIVQQPLGPHSLYKVVPRKEFFEKYMVSPFTLASGAK